MSADRAAPGARVRAAAATLLARVANDGVSLDRALAEAPDLEPRDQRLRSALVYGSLRWHHRLTWQLARLLSRPVRRRDAALGALLEVGLFELQFLRVPEHAAVSSAVEAAELLGLGRARGLANAVLRRFLRERAALDADLGRDEVARYSHPRWLIERLKQDWPDDWAAILEASNERAPMWLRVNVRRTTVDEYARELESQGLVATRMSEPATALELAEPIATARLPGFAAGLVSVQDAGAQLAAGYMALEPGLHVLDACAAPGGKTAHMLEACASLERLVAIDRDAERLEHVASNLDRLGLEAELVHADAAKPVDWWDGRRFDRILLDAPCSALGVIRRHPDIKLLRRPGDIEDAAAEQARLLAGLWPLLAPGGRLVYATCTLLATENADRVARFVETLGEDACRVASTRQLRPGEANMDGFYYACLDKQAEQ